MESMARDYLTGSRASFSGSAPAEMAIGDTVEVSAYSPTSPKHSATWECTSVSASLPSGAVAGDVAGSAMGSLYVLNTGETYYRFELAGDAHIWAFGADESAADNSVAIQAAINSKPNGDTVVILPIGFFTCTSPLTIYRGTVLRGAKQRQGGQTGGGPTRLYFSGSNGIETPLAWTPVNYPTVPARAHGCIIEDITIAGNDRSGGFSGVNLHDNAGGPGDVRPGLIKLNRVSIIEFDTCLNLNGHTDGVWVTSCDFGLCYTGVLGGHVDDFIFNTFFYDVRDYLIDTSCNRGVYQSLELFDLADTYRAVGVNIRLGTGTERGVGEHCLVVDCQMSGNDILAGVYVNDVSGARIIGNALHPSGAAIVFDGSSDFVCVGNTTKAHGQAAAVSVATAAVLVTGSALRGVIDGNAFATGGTFGTIGIKIDNGCFDIEIGANPCASAITTPLLDPFPGCRTRIGTKSINRQTALVNVVDSTAETALYTMTIPANTLRDGRSIRLTAHLDYLNSSGSDSDLTLNLKLGSTTVLTTGAVGLSTSATRRGIEVTAVIQARVSSSIADGTVRISAPGVSGVMAATANTLFGMNTNVAENLTTTLALVLTAQHGTASSNISARAEAWGVELL